MFGPGFLMLVLWVQVSLIGVLKGLSGAFMPGQVILFSVVLGAATMGVGGAPGITNFGYATSATFQELSNNSSPPNKQPCTVYRELPVVSRVANPDSVSVIADLGTGVLKIRFHRS